MASYNHSHWRDGRGTLAVPSDRRKQQQHVGGGGGGMDAATTGGTMDNGPRAKCDQVIFEAVAKAMEVVVGSRCSDGGGDVTNGSAGPSSAPRTLSSNGVGGTGRFNLQVAEISAVRSILQRWRRALHVPLRLDVYYQHEPNFDETGGHNGNCRRELLERWCLEYSVSGIGPAGPGPEASTLGQQRDPIVQLRHVCKRIVLWLRTLYCWTRLLPSQAFRSSERRQSRHHHHHHARQSDPAVIGFSIYVVSDGDDDVTDLVQSQGFQLHGRGEPSCSVTTPYGELAWKVVYAPASALRHLLQEPSSHYRQLAPLTGPRGDAYGSPHRRARPIPIQSGARDGVDNDGGGDGGRKARGAKLAALPQSAPARTASHPLAQGNDAGDPSPVPPARFRLSGAHMRERVQGENIQQQQKPQRQQPNLIQRNGHTLQRRHTSLGTGAELEQEHQMQMSPGPAEDKRHAPSGLSLALMMSDEQERANGDQHGLGSNNVEKDARGLDQVVTEKRRAALHQLPPHLVEQQQQHHHHQQQQQQHHHHQAAGASPSNAGTSFPPQQQRGAVEQTTGQGEYGYAYNSHIPWQRIQPSTTSPSPMDNMDAGGDCCHRNMTTKNGGSGSPSPSSIVAATDSYSGAPAAALATTGTSPAGAAFLAPPNASMATRGIAPPSRPPVTPPFAARPLGFVNDFASAPSPPQAFPMAKTVAGGAAAALKASNGVPGCCNPQQEDPDGAKIPPLTSLDLLHSSPFQQQPQGSLSLVSSLSVLGGGVPPTGFLESTAATGASAVPGVGGDGGGSFMRRSLWTSSAVGTAATVAHSLGVGGGAGVFPAASSSRYDDLREGYDYEEEMPFAVDMGTLPAGQGARDPGGTSSSSSSHLGVSSAAVASFANKCASTHRLKLFDSRHVAQQQRTSNIGEGGGGDGDNEAAASRQRGEEEDDAVGILADQLAEFRTFGESLQQLEGPTTTTAEDHSRHHPAATSAAPFAATSAAASTSMAVRKNSSAAVPIPLRT